MATLTQKTWADCWARIQLELKPEGLTTDETKLAVIEADCMGIANLGIAELSARAEMETAVWDNGQGGDLDLDSGNSTLLPIDFIAPEDTRHCVFWDGEALSPTSEAELNAEDEAWRTRTGEPGRWYTDGTYLYLDYVPGAGTLELRGFRIIGEFAAATPEAPNPLVKIRGDQQLSPVWYVLKEYPYNPEDPIQAARKSKGEKNWEKAVGAIIEGTRRRKDEAFSMFDGAVDYF